jgi:hypothetical protein
LISIGNRSDPEGVAKGHFRTPQRGLGMSAFP